MPDIFFMVVVLVLLVVVCSLVLFLHILQKVSDLGSKAMLGAVLVYLVERFKK